MLVLFSSLRSTNKVLQSSDNPSAVNMARGESELFATLWLKPRSSIYHIIRRYEQTGNSAYTKLSGLSRSQATQQNITKVTKLFIRCLTVSVRKAAQDLHLSKSTVSNIKVHHLGIKGYTRKRAPEYVCQTSRSESQDRITKTGLRKKCLITANHTFR